MLLQARPEGSVRRRARRGEGSGVERASRADEQTRVRRGRNRQKRIEERPWCLRCGCDGHQGGVEGCHHTSSGEDEG